MPIFKGCLFYVGAYHPNFMEYVLGVVGGMVIIDGGGVVGGGVVVGGVVGGGVVDGGVVDGGNGGNGGIGEVGGDGVVGPQSHG